jgi:hypothetical protein
MVSDTDSLDPYAAADLPLMKKEQRLVKELEGVRAARASIAAVRAMARPQIPTGESTGATVVNSAVNSEYYGLGAAEAAIKRLGLCNKQTQTVKKIWKALSDAGFSMLSDKPESSLSWVLRKREAKVGDVVLVGNGEWGLSTWYPDEEVERFRANRNRASGRNHDEHVERTKAGIEHARKNRGVKFGAPVQFTTEKVEQAKALLAKGKTITAVAKELGVSKVLLYSKGLSAALYRAKAEAGAATAEDEEPSLRLVK